jgi:hypothetical protein
MRIATESIKPNPNNPRTINESKFQQLVRSMTVFPQMLEKRPLVCFTDANGALVVLGGNMRLRAAQEIGMKDVPVILADDWTEEQRQEFLIKDNVNYGDWDWDALEENFDMDLMDDWGLNFPSQPEPEAPENDPFDDPGITARNQYGVIVMCEDEDNQEKVFQALSELGYNCKIVVT